MDCQLDTEVIDLAFLEKQFPKIPSWWDSLGRAHCGSGCPVAQLINLAIGPDVPVEVEENVVFIGGDWENKDTRFPTSDGVHLLVNLIDLYHYEDERVQSSWVATKIEYIKELGFV